MDIFIRTRIMCHRFCASLKGIRASLFEIHFVQEEKASWLVSCWILTSRQPHRVTSWRITSGRITNSRLLNVKWKQDKSFQNESQIHGCSTSGWSRTNHFRTNHKFTVAQCQVETQVKEKLACGSIHNARNRKKRKKLEWKTEYKLIKD